MKNVAPCIFAILVLIIGAYIIYQICDFCSRHFTNPSPPNPANPNATNVVDNVAWFLQPQSTPHAQVGSTEALVEQACDCGCSFIFTVYFANGMANLTNCFVPGSESEVAYRRQLDALGIDPGASSHPAEIVQDGAVISVLGSNMVTVVIERSHDLRNWAPIQTNAFPADRFFQTTVDGACSNSFYRVKL